MAKTKTASKKVLTKEAGIVLIKQLSKEVSTKAKLHDIVMRKCGWGKTKAYDVIREVEAQSQVVLPKKVVEVEPVKTVQEAKAAEDLFIVKQNYLYNKETEQYLVHATSGIVLLKKDKVEALRNDYTTEKDNINKLAMKHRIPKNILRDVLQKLEITHDSLPVSTEDLVDSDGPTLISSVLERKKFNISQELLKAEWLKIQENAKKWVEFEHGRLDPFKEMLDNWKAPEHKPIAYSAVPKRTKSGRVYVAAAYDWHIGALSEGRYMSRGREWNTTRARKAVEEYAKQVFERVSRDPIGFDKGIIIFGGDLFNSVSGYTSNGTSVKCDFTGDQQFQDSELLTIHFIDSLTPLFEKLDVYYVKGNHGGLHDFPLGRVINAHYRNDPKVTVNVFSKRAHVIKEGNVMFGFEHGASAETKNTLPDRDAARDLYINNVFNGYPELIPGTKHRIFLVGDKHHYIHKEMANYDFIQSGSLPCGDLYAESTNKYNKARQNGFILNADGLECTHQFFVEDDEEDPKANCKSSN